jgi:hypothetical protein
LLSEPLEVCKRYSHVALCKASASSPKTPFFHPNAQFHHCTLSFPFLSRHILPEISEGLPRASHALGGKPVKHRIIRYSAASVAVTLIVGRQIKWAAVAIWPRSVFGRALFRGLVAVAIYSNAMISSYISGLPVFVHHLPCAPLCSP